MKESKAVYVTKRDIKVELNKDFPYTNKVIRDRELSPEPLRYDQKTQEAGCQYDSKRDNLICTCRNLATLRKRQEVRYFGLPKQIYAYHGSRSFTDIGVGSVKALQRKKVKKIYLPTTDDRGVGSSELSSYLIRRSRQHRGSSYYDNKKTSSKCVGGILEYNTGCVMHEKLSPIIQTVSGSTSPRESKINKNIEIGSNTIVKSLTNTTTQVEDSVKIDIDIKPVVKIEEIKPVLILHEDTKEMKTKTITETNKPTERNEKITDKEFSSDSLVQHVHNLENPSDDKQSHISIDTSDPMENKLEREYRRIFSAKSKESKQSSDKPLPDFKSTSTLKRRFEALRRGLAKREDSKKNAVIVTKVSSQISAPSRKDVSINSDPPSLEGRSFSNTKTYSPYTQSYSRDQTVYNPRTSQYKRSVTSRKERDSAHWSSRPDDDDSECQGVKGMFKLWGKKFNLEEDYYKNRATPKPSYAISKQSEKKVEEPKLVIKTSDIEEKKEGRKFFFFKKKNKDKPYKSKKGVTTGRCEVRDGLMIKIGTGGNAFVPEVNVKEPKVFPVSEEYEDIVRKAWLKKFLSQAIESRNSVQIRWNNNTYATSSSTVFELMDNVYKNTGVVFRSKSQVAVQPSYKSYKQHVNFVHQNIEAWMIPKTITDRPKLLPAKVKCKSDEERKDNIEVRISDQKWFIDKSKAFSHKIEVVLHSKNFVKVNKEASSEYLRIDIPKGFFVDSSSDDNNKQVANQFSDEKVFKIVEYETGSDLNKDRTTRNFDIGDHKQNNIKVTVSVKENKDCDSMVLETMIKRPPVHRDVVIQGSNVYIPKRCDVIGVGIITQRELREIQKPILKIQDDFSDEESEHNILRSNQKKCEFAQSYLQDYYRNWTPLGIDLYSWCVSDSHLRCCSENSKASINNQGDVTKSCPNIFDDFQTSAIVSSCGASSCSHSHTYEEADKPPGKCTWFKLKKKSKDPNGANKRILPKDSIEVFRRRKIYAASLKSKWGTCPIPCPQDFEQTCSVPSNESKSAQNTLTECPKLKKSCCKPIEPRPKKRTCKKHVSLPDCDTMNDLLAKQLADGAPEGILAFKGSSGCDACKRKGTCLKHAKMNPTPSCEIPRPPCLDSCEKMKKPPCAASKMSCDKQHSCSPTPSPGHATPPTGKKPLSCPPSPPPCKRLPSGSETPLPCPPSPSPHKKSPSPRLKLQCKPSPPPSKKKTPSCPPSPSPPTCKKHPSGPPSPPSCPHTPPCPPTPPGCPHSPPCPPSPQLGTPSPPRCPHSPPSVYPPPCQKPTPLLCPHPPCTPPPPPCYRKAKPCPLSSSSCPATPPSCCSMDPNASPAVPPPCKKGSSLCRKLSPLFKKKKMCPASPPGKPTPCKPSFCKPLGCQPSPSQKFSEMDVRVSYGSLTHRTPDAPYYYSPVHPCPPEPPEKPKKIGSPCNSSPCNRYQPNYKPPEFECKDPNPQMPFPEPQCDQCRTSTDDFPWPTKNQVSNQASVTSLYESVPQQEAQVYGTCSKNCPMMPKLSCETIPSPKKECKASCPNRQGSPRPPCMPQMQCPPPKPPSPPCSSPPRTPPPSNAPVKCKSKSKVSGLYLKMKPAPKTTTCSKDCLAWSNSQMEDGCISLNSEEKITIRLKKETPSTEEIREGLNIKVQDEDGMTLFERKDYRLQHAGCSVHGNSLLGDMYKASEVRRVTTNDSVQAIVSDRGCRKEIIGGRSDASIANLIEIQFKLKVTQGEKTTEINIANDGDKENEVDERTEKDHMNNNPQEVFIVKNEGEHTIDQSDQKNDINIRIVIKNFKPKSGKKKSVNLKHDDYSKDFSKKISAKFHTVSTGYSDVLHDDNVFSVHRATVDLTSSVDKSKTHSNKSEEVMSEPLNEHAREFLTGSEQSICRCITTDMSDCRIVEEDLKSIPSRKYSVSKEIQEYPEDTDTEKPTDHKYDTEETDTDNKPANRKYDTEETDTDRPANRKYDTEETDTDNKPANHKYDTEETDTDNKPANRKYDTEETDTEKPPEAKYDTDGTDTDNKLVEPKYDTFISTDTDEQDAIPEHDTYVEKPKSIEVIVKPHTKDEKKEMLKHVFQKAHETKTKSKNRMKKLRDMLKVILTSDSSDHDENKLQKNDLAKDVTYASLKPNYFRDSDSMNNYYRTESNAISDAEINRQVVYPTGENNSEISNSNPSDVLSSENESPNHGCMCSTLAARLKLASRIGDGGGCCCGPKTNTKKNEETTCDLNKDSDYFQNDYETAECVDVETQNSRYLTSKINSTNLSIHTSMRSNIMAGVNTKQAGTAYSGIINVDEKTFIPPRKTFSPHMNHVRECEMRRLNRNTVLSMSDEDKIVQLSGRSQRLSSETTKSRKKKFRDPVTVLQASDILQSYETKKAVLEIYTEKTVSDDGERLVAKLPKFVYDRENEIQTNYEAIATNTYKAVCKKNIVMMAINR